ncbi:MAG: hypothetical protein METHAR1v1_430019 [Methanothrix sp.]|jgi:hypothetical protein|nr:MAG: hypothetical protein METHAR1v1_430019 [Methanothrix sp.]
MVLEVIFMALLSSGIVFAITLDIFRDIREMVRD